MPLGDQFDPVLAAARAGAAWGFERLYEEFNPPLLRYLVSRAGGEGDDLTSEVWLGVARRIGLFEGGEREFRSWLFTIAHRRLADFLNDRGRRATDAVDPETMERLIARDDPESEVVEQAAAQAAASRIARILTAEQAEVVLLRLLGGLDVDEVAAIVGKRTGTVRVLQHRALKKLLREISLEDVMR